MDGPKTYPHCTVDLALIGELEATHDPEKANRLLDEGWHLLAASIDHMGFPALVLGKARA